MRPIDADALIEKCGDWYVEEGTESGFIGTLKNLLATMPTIQPEKAQLSRQGTTKDAISKTETVEHLRRVLEATVPNTDYDEGYIDGIEFGISTVSTMPTIQPQSTAGQLNDGAQSTNLIDRQQAIDALDFEIVHMTAYCDGKNEGNPLAQYNKGLEDGKKAIEALPSAQPEPQEGTTDLISRQAAIDAAESAYVRNMFPTPLIREVPPVEPGQHEGEWSDGYRWQRCSLCKQTGKKSWNYCPNCGAKMTISTK